jgi:hypothetical protein
MYAETVYDKKACPTTNFRQLVTVLFWVRNVALSLSKSKPLHSYTVRLFPLHLPPCVSRQPFRVHATHTFKFTFINYHKSKPTTNCFPYDSPRRSPDLDTPWFLLLEIYEVLFVSRQKVDTTHHGKCCSHTEHSWNCTERNTWCFTQPRQKVIWKSKLCASSMYVMSYCS